MKKGKIEIAYKTFIDEHSKYKERVMLWPYILNILDIAKEEAKAKGGYTEGKALDNFIVATVGYKSGYSMGYEMGLKASKIKTIQENPKIRK